MRQMALEWFKKEVSKNSFEGERFASGAYDVNEKMKKRYLPNGKLRVKALYVSLGTEDPTFVLLKRILQLDLKEDQVLEIINYRFKQCYIEKDISWLGKCALDLPEIYKGWCENFKVKPNKEFAEELKKYTIMYEKGNKKHG